MIARITLALALASTPARWDLQIEADDRLSLPAPEMQRVLENFDRSTDLIRTATAAAARWRSAVVLSEDARAFDRARLEAEVDRLSSLAEPRWYEAPILWMSIGLALGAGAIALGGVVTRGGS